MSQEYSLCPQSTVYVLRVQSTSQRIQFMYLYNKVYVSPENSLSPRSTVYVPRVQFMSSKDINCTLGTVYVLRVQFMSSEYSLCP